MSFRRDDYAWSAGSDWYSRAVLRVEQGEDPEEVAHDYAENTEDLYNLVTCLQLHTPEED